MHDHHDDSQRHDHRDDGQHQNEDHHGGDDDPIFLRGQRAEGDGDGDRQNTKSTAPFLTPCRSVNLLPKVVIFFLILVKNRPKKLPRTLYTLEFKAYENSSRHYVPRIAQQQ